MTENQNIILNGEAKSFARLNLLEILKTIEVDLESKGVAVAIDDKLVRKSEWESYKLLGGERVEVITAAQGG